MHKESHRSGQIGWLRAAVLGANDGLIFTSSLVVGVATAGPSRSSSDFSAGAPWPGFRGSSGGFNRSLFSVATGQGWPERGTAG